MKLRLLVLMIALSPGFTPFGSNAGAHEGDCKPTYQWDYTDQELEVIATFDLSDCWGNEPFGGKTRFWRFDQNSWPFRHPSFPA